MEHRGIAFQVVQTIPHGWRWSFACDHFSKAGTARTRDVAVNKAKQAIDLALRTRCAPKNAQHAHPD